MILQNNKPKYIALVPAAGSGKRFGASTPKQYLDLLGKPLIYHALTTLNQCEAIDEVWVALSPEDEWWADFNWTALEKLKVIHCGGETRAQSVLNALLRMSEHLSGEDWVLVHDAVRPCLSQTMLSTLLEELREDKVGGLLAVPVADTLKLSDENQRVAATHPREGLWQAQTPQMFRYGLLCEALKDNNAVTDEASAIESLGLSPRLVRSATTNLKVTYPADLKFAALILQEKEI